MFSFKRVLYSVFIQNYYRRVLMKRGQYLICFHYMSKFILKVNSINRKNNCILFLEQISLILFG
ncbi:hypothetical protein KsCSTR_02730 [Candidatus Kuenenia stuttgartiensis]|uniref:Uncharacterized protein n=1 Tax=Kuenenia stuttgartiensis TaxID=174633 RepID=Q1PY44_KUEST|nr:hypothetical protein KsCSTR_02730 [Candidatus Kuenenia stuttgartiensis]CAJ72958.1 unknown protein [Candidatus Kuenenia stuttgartiensis]